MSHELVLITGITGFVGSNLKPYLNQNGFYTKGISRKENPQTDIVTYNECNVELLDKSLAIVHLAGKAHDLKKVSSEQEYYDINTDLTANLFDTFLKSKSEIFIFLSTVKAVADKVDNILIETKIANPQTVYGKSKLKAEEYILSHNIPNNKKVYILRPCMIHGPNNKGNLNLLYTLVKKGIPFPLGSYKNVRSFLSVENLSFVIKTLIEKKPDSGIYNVADDDAISTNNLVKIMAKTLNKKGIILNVPKILISKLAFFGDLLKLPFSNENLMKLTDNYVVSNNKIKMIVGELPLTSRQGIELTINSFKRK